MEILHSQAVADMMASSGVQFGTSGARGLVSAMTDEVCYGYTQGFLRYLAELGEFAAGGSIALAGDLRASTPRILTACAAAIADMGGTPVFCGYVPTPVLAFYALGRGRPSLMVTGSHIPDDRNGIKFYRSAREMLKPDEAGMSRQPVSPPPGRFTANGALADPPALPAPVDAESGFLARYRDFFGTSALSGMTIGVYQHSAVGRDLLVAALEALGAKAVPLGRSDTFIPVDTEAVREADRQLAAQWAGENRFDAIVSTDGDSDRPLLSDEHGRWLRGDILGVLCAQALGADCVVTPVSSNTVLERSGGFAETVRTRIGSPYVIAAMEEAEARRGGLICGYEANGGFLLGCEVERGGARLGRLATRDAFLPILAILVQTRKNGQNLSSLAGSLARRVTFSERIQDFPTERSKALLARLTEGSGEQNLARLEELFGPVAGAPTAIDLTDGLRISFASGAIIHLRPSGNAPELRCYSEAETEEEAMRLNTEALAIVRGL